MIFLLVFTYDWPEGVYSFHVITRSRSIRPSVFLGKQSLKDVIYAVQSWYFSPYILHIDIFKLQMSRWLMLHPIIMHRDPRLSL